MSLRQATVRDDAGRAGQAMISIGERCMALLLEGAVLNVPAIGQQTYHEFRVNLDRLASQIPDPCSEDEKLLLTRAILHEFENYHHGAQRELSENLMAWQGVVTLLLAQLLEAYGIQDRSHAATTLMRRTRALKSSDDVDQWREEVEKFLEKLRVKAPEEDCTSPLKRTNRSTANDNAAGLPGGGCALEYLRTLMAAGSDGYVVLFELRCMEIISQRFGMEAVEDCLMAVSSFLTQGLDGNDKIYHWSNSSLLAVVQGRPNEEMLTSEIQRIICRNRESTICVGGRPMIVRIPLSFEITPINRLRSPEDLLRHAERKQNR